MDIQAEFDELYGLFVNDEITRREYADAINASYGRTVCEIVGFNRRRDTRTPGEFALWIFDTTQRERYLMEACWPQIADAFGGTSYSDLGLDNEGRLILNAAGRNARLDFLVEQGGGSSFPLEVKFAPHQRFLTYKIDDLTNYLKTPDARVLTVAADKPIPGPNGRVVEKNPRWGEGDAVLSNRCWMMVFDHDAIETVVRIGEHGAHQGFGGKNTVRIHPADFEKVAKVELIEELIGA